jgi:hypothetical protein
MRSANWAVARRPVRRLGGVCIIDATDRDVPTDHEEVRT